METIDSFKGQYFFLSNFLIEADGKSVEHRFQAAKTDRLEEKKRIMDAPTPSKAKYYGRMCSMRPDWEEVKNDVMYELVKNKFAHPDLHRRLLETGDAYLVEGNTWGDKYWGVDAQSGEGENHLGLILMRVRGELTRHTPLV